MSKPGARSCRALVSCLAILALLLGARPAVAEEDSRSRWHTLPEQTFDLLILRPLGVGGLAVGLGFFAVAGPLAAPSGQLPYAWDTLVKGLYKFTFERSLGDLN